MEPIVFHSPIQMVNLVSWTHFIKKWDKQTLSQSCSLCPQSDRWTSTRWPSPDSRRGWRASAIPPSRGTEPRGGRIFSLPVYSFQKRYRRWQPILIKPFIAVAVPKLCFGCLWFLEILGTQRYAWKEHLETASGFDRWSRSSPTVAAPSGLGGKECTCYPRGPPALSWEIESRSVGYCHHGGLNETCVYNSNIKQSIFNLRAKVAWVSLRPRGNMRCRTSMNLGTELIGLARTLIGGASCMIRAFHKF